MQKMEIKSNYYCPRCGMNDARLLHMIWECTKLGPFWKGFLDILKMVYTIDIAVDCKMCLVGLLEILDIEFPI